MNYEDIEGLSDSQILELYDDDLISTEWYVWCANGRTGFYGDSLWGSAARCRYCGEYCATWQGVCGGTTFNGRYAYECITTLEPTDAPPNSVRVNGVWWLIE